MDIAIQRLKEKIEKNIVNLDTKDIKIDGAFFSTEDGFIISHKANDDTNIEEKKIAAIISALYGICSAGGQEIENNKAKSIIVEYEKTILLLINFNFENENYLMALLSNKKNNLAQVLFIGNTFIKILQS